MKLIETALNFDKNAFGFTLEQPKSKTKLSAIEIEKTEGTLPYGGFYDYQRDFFLLPSNESELLKTYRSLAITPEMERALNEIKNEIFVFDDPNSKAIELDFDDDGGLLDETIKDRIVYEFNTLYRLLNFQRTGIDLFMKFYIDGKLIVQKVVDNEQRPTSILKLVTIDPMNTKKVVKLPEPNKDGTFDLNKVQTYYVHNTDVGGGKVVSQTITEDSLVYIDSGIYDPVSKVPLSYIWKSIIPYNNMKMLEEALLVYRVVRSPERRVFYINVGNLSKVKAEQYIQELMNKFKNKLVYDTQTGSIANRKNILSMTEDYWLPRRDDGKGTEIETLPGAVNQGSLDDVQLFTDKFYMSTGVPPSRFKDQDGAQIIFGNSSQVNRDEYRFKKFLDRLRNRFILLFEDLLKTQLVLKNVISIGEWEPISAFIRWKFVEDNNFVKLKETEYLSSQLGIMAQLNPFIQEQWFSREWAYKTVMDFTDEQIQQMHAQIYKEMLQMQGMNNNENNNGIPPEQESNLQ